MSWNDGYVADIDYATEFVREQSPVYLNFACVLNGFEPVPLDRPFTYCELGFGRGFTVNLLAASNPQGRFYAADFLPSQVVGAQQMADAAQLDNLTLLENSFAELAEGKVADLPQFDFVTMHGIYTWISAENRRHIANFLTRYLKPGGIVYIGYNTLPGWSAAGPLQRLMREYADRHPDRSDAQIIRARDFIRQMADAKARYFDATPSLKCRLNALQEEDTRYLAHEYMNRNWQPMYHADVAAEMAAAKLDYVGFAELPMVFPELYLSVEQRQILDAAPDTTMRETLRDYMLNTAFRKDVFVRGARHMKPARRAECLAQMGLALTVGRAAATLDMKWMMGTVTGEETLYLPLFDALAQRPHTLAELAALPELEGQSLHSLAEAAALLMASRQAAVYYRGAEVLDRAPACRLNRAIGLQSCHDDDNQALASPLIGNGVPAGLVERLVYLCLSEGAQEQDVDAIARRVLGLLALQGERLTGKEQSQEEEETEVTRVVKAILERRMPVWRRLKML
jgi:SAM-dependent methyltransferase